MRITVSNVLAFRDAIEALKKGDNEYLSDDWNNGRYTGLDLALDIFQAIFYNELIPDKKPKQPKPKTSKQ